MMKRAREKMPKMKVILKVFTFVHRTEATREKFSGICNKHKISIKHMTHRMCCWRFFFLLSNSRSVVFAICCCYCCQWISFSLYTVMLSILFAIVSRLVNIPKPMWNFQCKQFWITWSLTLHSAQLKNRNNETTKCADSFSWHDTMEQAIKKS